MRFDYTWTHTYAHGPGHIISRPLSGAADRNGESDARKFSRAEFLSYNNWISLFDPDYTEISSDSFSLQN